MHKTKFGLTLNNRGILYGATTVPEMLELAERADRDGWDGVWVGDSILAKPRLDAIVLLSAIAGRTKRVRLGAACMASTPLRNPLVLASQWASLDRLSEGRTIFVPCQGEGGTGGGAFHREFAAFGHDTRSRMRRMEEAIEIMRLTSTGTNVSYAGEFVSFEDVTIEPRPVQQPIPMWVTANPSFERPRHVESAYRRVAKYGDGWMTVVRTPDEFRQSLPMIRRYAEEEGRTLPDTFEVCLYYNINVNEDAQAAYDESKKVLDLYYDVSWSEAYHRAWTALGSPAQCAAQLREYVDAGVTTLLLRPASFDCAAQYRRITEHVLPRLA